MLPLELRGLPPSDLTVCASNCFRIEGSVMFNGDGQRAAAVRTQNRTSVLDCTQRAPEPGEQVLLSSRRNELREAEAETLGSRGLFGGQVPVSRDLVGQRMLLHAARIAGGLRWPGGVVADRLFEIVGQQCGLTQGEKLSPHYLATAFRPRPTKESG